MQTMDVSILIDFFPSIIIHKFIPFSLSSTVFFSRSFLEF